MTKIIRNKGVTQRQDTGSCFLTLVLAATLTGLCGVASAQQRADESFLPAIITLMLDDEPKVCEKTPGAPDFNGDGCADLAVGAPHSGFDGGSRLGQVNVFYGATDGIANDQVQTITLNGIYDHQGNHMGDLIGTGSSSDLFGSTITTGDFNNDNYTDLAIGVSLENVGSVVNPGVVHVIYGSSQGLRAEYNQMWHQGGGFEDSMGTGVPNFLGDIAGGLEDNDRFGQSLASGDFNGDGFDDLAIGVPHEDIGSISNAGSVQIIYGSNTRLTYRENEFWHQNDVSKRQLGFTSYVSIGDILGGAEAGDFFGEELTVGNFNGDEYDDLAIGAFGEEIGGVSNAGAFNLVHGGETGLQTANNYHWFQGVDPIWDTDGDGVADVSLPGLGLVLDAEDRFADTMVAGDFNRDGFDDLAIGAPLEDLLDPRVSSSVTINDVGLVTVMYGTDDSLRSNGAQFILQDSIFTQGGGLPGGAGSFEAGERLGTAMSVGDINGDGYHDLVLGSPNEGDDTQGGNVGSAMVVYGFGDGLTVSGAQYFSPVQSYAQGNSRLADLIGEPGGGFYFGEAVSVLDLNGDGYDELVIGTPRYEAPISNDEIGSVHVLIGSRQGARTSGHQFWTPLGGSTGNPAAPRSLGTLWGLTLGEKRFGAAFSR